MEYPRNPFGPALLDRAQSSPPSPRSAPSRTIPKAIREMMLELGLRYRPNQREDIDEHAARLALLTRDLADLPAAALRFAIDRWVLSSPYMPKAAELADLARQYLAEPARARSGELLPLETQAEIRNRELELAGNYRIRWLIADGGWQPIDYLDWLERQDDPESRAEVRRLRRARGMIELADPFPPPARQPEEPPL